MAAAGGTNGDNDAKSASVIMIDNSQIGAVPGRDGEKILSNKNRQQLAEENDQLRKKVNMLEKKVDKLQKCITTIQNSDTIDDDDDRDEREIESSNSDFDSAEN